MRIRKRFQRLRLKKRGRTAYKSVRQHNAREACQLADTANELGCQSPSEDIWERLDFLACLFGR